MATQETAKVDGNVQQALKNYFGEVPNIEREEEHLLQHLIRVKLHKFDFEGTTREERMNKDKRDLTNFRRNSYKRIINPEEGEYSAWELLADPKHLSPDKALNLSRKDIMDMTNRAEDIKSNFFKRIERHIFSKYDNVATVKRSASEKQEKVDDKIKKLDSVREIEPKVMGQFKVYKEDVDLYRRVIKDLAETGMPKTEDFARIFDEAVLFALLMLAVDDVCTNTGETLDLLENFLEFLLRHHTLVMKLEKESNKHIWRRGGVDFKQIRLALRDSFKGHKTDSGKKKNEFERLHTIRSGNNFSTNKIQPYSDDVREEFFFCDLLLTPLAHAIKHGHAKCCSLILDPRFETDPHDKIRFSEFLHDSLKENTPWNFKKTRQNPTAYDFALVGKVMHYKEDTDWVKDGWEKILREIRKGEKLRFRLG